MLQTMSKLKIFAYMTESTILWNDLNPLNKVHSQLDNFLCFYNMVFYHLLYPLDFQE